MCGLMVWSIVEWLGKHCATCTFLVRNKRWLVKVHMLEDTHRILKELCGDEWSNTYVAYVSRTTYPKWAKTCLKLLQVTPGVSMDQLGALQVLSPCLCSSCNRVGAVKW